MRWEKAWQRIIDAIGVALIILILFFPISLLFRVPYPLMVVSSSSMAPSIGRGDVVFVYPSKNVNLGDVVLLNVGGRVVLHRVVNLTVIGGSIAIQTKGDRDKATDQYMAGIPYSTINDVYGKALAHHGYVFKIPCVGAISLALKGTFIDVLSSPVKTAFLISLTAVLASTYFVLGEIKPKFPSIRFKNEKAWVIMLIALFYVGLLYVNYRNSSISSVRVIVDPKSHSPGLILGGGVVLGPGEVKIVPIKVSNKGLFKTFTVITLSSAIRRVIIPSINLFELKAGELRVVDMKIDAPNCSEITRFEGKIYAWNIPFGYWLPSNLLVWLSMLNPLLTFMIANTILYAFIVLIFLVPYLIFSRFIKRSSYRLKIEVEESKYAGNGLRSFHRNLYMVKGRETAKLSLKVIILLLIFTSVLAFEYLTVPVVTGLDVTPISRANYALRDYNWSKIESDSLMLDFEIIPPGYSMVHLENVFLVYNFDDEEAYLSVDVNGDLREFIEAIYCGGTLIWTKTYKSEASIPADGNSSLDFYITVPPGVDRRKYDGTLNFSMRDVENSEKMNTNISMTLEVDKPFVEITYIQYNERSFKWYIDAIYEWWWWRIYVMHWEVDKRVDLMNNGTLGLDLTVLKEEGPSRLSTAYLTVYLVNATEKLDVTSYVSITGPIDSDGDHRYEWNITLANIPSTPWRSYLRPKEMTVYFFHMISTRYIFVTYIWQPPPDPDPITMEDDAWGMGGRWLRTVGEANSSWDYEYVRQILDGPVDPPPINIPTDHPVMIRGGAEKRSLSVAPLKFSYSYDWNGMEFTFNIDGNADAVYLLLNQSVNCSISKSEFDPKPYFVDELLNVRLYRLYGFNNGKISLYLMFKPCKEPIEVNILIVKGGQFKVLTITLPPI